jgi:hypothetical protein
MNINRMARITSIAATGIMIECGLFMGGLLIV